MIDIGVEDERITNALLKAFQEFNTEEINKRVLIKTLLKTLRDIKRERRDYSGEDWDEEKAKRIKENLMQVQIGYEGVHFILENLAKVQYIDRKVRRSHTAIMVSEQELEKYLTIDKALKSPLRLLWYISQLIVNAANRNNVLNKESHLKELLTAAYDKDKNKRKLAAEKLGELEIRDPRQLRRVLVALNYCLNDWNINVYQTAFRAMERLLDGRSIPNYQRKPSRKKRLLAWRSNRVFWLVEQISITIMGIAIPFTAPLLLFLFFHLSNLISLLLTVVLIITIMVAIDALRKL